MPRAAIVRLLPVRALLSIAILGMALAVRPGTPATEPAKSKRIAWTTSRVVGSPEPPAPYKVVQVYQNLKFDHPLLLTRGPGADRFVVGEQAGVLYSFIDKPDAKAELFCDLRKELKTIGQLPDAQEFGSLYGLVFHPRFQENRQCFVCFTLRGSDRKARNLKDGTRVSRFTVTKTDPPRIDPDSEEVIISFLQGGHNGGDLHFGNDGMLYISTGDASTPNPPDDFNTGQSIADLLASILRIDVDHQDQGLKYAIPKDNPFVGRKDARGEVWAYGFRNPWRMSFDRTTGELYVGDVGWELWEMIHRVEKGGNYGWSAMEGPQPIKPSPIGPTPIRPALIELPHAIACSVTGGYVYRGKKFPELRGAYVFGDWETRRLWAARFDGDRVKEMPEITRPSVRIVSFGEDKDGEILFLDYDGGTVHGLARNDGEAQNKAFPTKLSETGLFASVKEHVPAPGVVPYLINARQWQDGATAEYHVALPNETAATIYSQGRSIPGNVTWRKFRVHFPKDAVLQRTLSLGKRRVETQLLHFDGIDWQPYTFAWRDDQTDADMVPAEGAEKEIHDGQQKRVWQYHSRSQCMSCHNHSVEITLSFSAEQLNRAGPDGRNQLIALSEAGLLRPTNAQGNPLPSFDDGSVARERKLADPMDPAGSLDARARAYLHANCGHCHSDGGGGSVGLRLQFNLTPSQLKAIDERPTRGDFGLADACIVKSGQPYSSTLYYRMAKFGRDRMPHFGSEIPDEEGLKLIERWIAQLNGSNSETSPDLQRPLATVPANPTQAQPIARLVGRGELKPDERERLLASAGKLPSGPARDLFEGYLPHDANAVRKLGSNPRPLTILSLKGDPLRGEKLFVSKALNCASCHKIGEQGVPLGPDLTTIGKQRTREDLLDSILAPSRRIEPKFSSYVARCVDGRTIIGLLVRRDEKELVLRDAQNKEFKLAADDVEELRPSRVSLMPDGQLSGLTAQEAADLLDYLSSRR